MLKRILGRRKSRRVFLSDLSVMPRSDWKRHLESGGVWPVGRASVPSGYVLDELLAHLPRVEERTDPREDDLMLDVCVVKHQLGELWLVDGWPWNLILLWRPKVEVVMRVTESKSGKLLDLLRVTERMPWREFLYRKLTFRGLLGPGSVFDARDLNQLLARAAARIIRRIEKWR